MVFYQNQVPSEGNKVFQKCVHCGADVGYNVQYCRFCDTKEKRETADKENETLRQEPWVSLGISRSTYFRRKEEVTADLDGLTGGCPKHPHNKGDITRDQMKNLLEGGSEFIPNWYKSGHSCREEASLSVMKTINGSKRIKAQKLTGEDA